MTDQQKSILNLFSLEGKTVIVTGGTGGLGAAMSIALAQAGANIVSLQLPDDPLGKTFQEEIEKLHRQFSVFECNLTDPGSIREVFASMWAAGIVPDILLNCAGTNRRGKIEDISDEDINLVLDVNLKAAYIMSQEFGKQLLTLSRPGKIIHVSSMASYIAQTNVSIYAISKAGVRHMTKALSNEWAGKGIQCNCICPG
ncbi:hypothetical protein FE257_012420 [Aspergillus nanangensis]|uniref:2-deoxy-D-gluconate 3-dehydrogenase n=1 Tax=Aspergillus nanangensis TaxID=2582783 RepID=A0AAD4GWQ1_ASPNN|nr:hypothetical protein FE257_012420 [Aspergillus nanangensis]